VLAGFNSARNKTNLERCRATYGSNPCVYAQIWEDLQNTNNPETQIDATNKRIANLDKFMLTIHFFECYTSEARLAASFNICEKSARTACWFYAKKVQALKTEKVSPLSKRNKSLQAGCSFKILTALDQIVWPEHWATGSLNIPAFLLSVDGIHCRIEEPMHPTKSKDKSYYSHKFNQAGLAYELGIAAYENRLVWVNGPFRASRHDVTILRRCGLKDKIPEGHKVIGDNGYVGEKLVVSTPNAHDPLEVS